jgi:hypothetical protein
MSKYCKECGKKLNSDSVGSYCANCDELMDRKFNDIQIKILETRDISEEEIRFLNRFDEEEIIELYYEIKKFFIDNKGIGEKEALLLLKLQKAFSIDDAGIKNSNQIYCPECGKVILREAVVCPFCGIQLKNLQIELKSPKSKDVAVVLAFFFGFWSWLYTYKKDALKFWIFFGIFSLSFIYPIYSGINDNWFFLLINIVGWFWAVINSIVRPLIFYLDYPDVKRRYINYILNFKIDLQSKEFYKLTGDSFR